MRRIRWATIGLAVALLGSVTVGTTTATGLPGRTAAEKPAATEIGVTADEIRVAVVADVDNQFAPGVFQGSVDGVKGWAKFVNAHGGLAGRKVVVDFIDSKLTADDARNAVIKACAEDFALVGTTAVFLNNVDDVRGLRRPRRRRDRHPGPRRGGARAGAAVLTDDLRGRTHPRSSARRRTTTPRPTRATPAEPSTTRGSSARTSTAATSSRATSRRRRTPTVRR